MKNILQKIMFLCILTLCTILASAQTEKQKNVTGTITDVNNEPLIGVTVILKNQPGFGVATDDNGRFAIKAGEYDVLVISYVGFKPQEIPVLTVSDDLKVVLEEETKKLEEVVVTAAGTVQRKATLTGAVTTVNVGTLRTPTGSISNALVGNVAGIIGYQATGEPGENNTEFWVRGISTFGANAKALVLVDGIERDFNELNVEDIESFSVLKDASATAIYGSRGANGVLLVTTKRGEAGKVKINFKAEYGYNTRSRTPEYVDGPTYANMANESLLSRYQYPIYSPQDMVAIERGLDPDLFPNVDWSDIILRDGANNYRATLSFQGGGSAARYYVSGSYYKEEGMYNTNSKMNKYDTNTSYERYNYRANIDLNITSSTVLSFGIGGFLINRNRPHISSDDIWGSLSRLTPLTVPRMYSNGLIPTYGSEGYAMNPEAILTRTGYQTNWENKMETNVSLNQDLDFVTPGLKFLATFSFDSKNDNTISRVKYPELWRALGRDAKGDLMLNRVRETSLMTLSGNGDANRRYYGEMRLSYEKLINEAHRFSGLLMYFQQEKTVTTVIANDARSGIPLRNMALSGRATYGFKDRYLAEFNFGYTGSENFERGERFGFFPAISFGWVISEEPFVKENVSWLDMFKIRYSYGEVGNDKLTDDEKDYTKRFPYLSFIGTSASMNWGEYGSNLVQGYRITTVGSSNLTWEKAKKHNLGLDVILGGDKVSLTVDAFKDIRRDIFKIRGQMPYSTGLQDLQPYANIGEMETKGFDATGSYIDRIGNVGFTLRGNITYQKSNVINADEADNALYYQMEKGYRLNQTRGLIALGLFKDQEDIDTSPSQSAFGSYLPGDIKYKDVNGDGIIDDKDVVPIGYSHTPSLSYGVGLDLTWKDFNFSVLFQGSGKNDFFLGGDGIYPFRGMQVGNILKDVSDPNDRWIPREISGDPATENPDAIIPRLSYGPNSNNYRNSTFWLRNGRYVRLKNLEFGYTVPRHFTKRFFIESARIGFIGRNLFVFSPFKWWDPEIGSSDGAKYPIAKTYSFNLQVNF
ncbi:MAG: TonB-dependent receptor [Prevotella sp.]|jgi:TonB-linked SusC/RagA family outer membrane protein|nr:TonB-dependent receptor [Prevotella sp.]